MTDIYDGAEWTEMDIEDLKSAIEHSRSIEEVAEFLCRSSDDVAQMCGVETDTRTTKSPMTFRSPAV